MNNLFNLINPTSLPELNLNDDTLVPNGLTDSQYTRFQLLRKSDLTTWIHQPHLTPTLYCHLCPSLSKSSCLKCGRSFCVIHIPAQIKLGIDAKRDSVNGIWSRSCVECFREEVVEGVSRRRTQDFFTRRTRSNLTIQMDVNRVVQRLAKLKKGDNNVEWQSASKCTDCLKMFSLYFRKHHCRLCGKLICFECSKSIDESRACSNCLFLLTLQVKHKIDSTHPLLTLYNDFIRLSRKANDLTSFYNSLIKEKKDQYQKLLVLRKEILDIYALIEKVRRKCETRNDVVATSLARRIGTCVMAGVSSLKGVKERKKEVHETIGALNIEWERAVKDGREDDAQLVMSQIQLILSE